MYTLYALDERSFREHPKNLMWKGSNYFWYSLRSKMDYLGLDSTYQQQRHPRSCTHCHVLMLHECKISYKTCCCRDCIYPLFINYESVRKRNKFFDNMDLVGFIHKRLKIETYKGVPILAVFRDEVSLQHKITNNSYIFNFSTTPCLIFTLLKGCQEGG